MAKNLYVDEVGSRLEMIQKKREQLLEKIEKNDGWEKDEGLSITYTQTLNGYEAQELKKYKFMQDQEEGDRNRNVAIQAFEMVREIRNMRRDGRIENDAISDDVTIPEVDQRQMQGVEANQTAVDNRNYKGGTWTEFQKEMIGKGLDPNFMLDEEGNIVPVPKDE